MSFSKTTTSFRCRLHICHRRLRGSGRIKRMENSSDESEEEPPDSDNSEEDIGHHENTSIEGKSSLDSEDDPPENRRPGRNARTRAKVTLTLVTITYANWKTRQKYDNTFRKGSERKVETLRPLLFLRGRLVCNLLSYSQRTPDCFHLTLCIPSIDVSQFSSHWLSSLIIVPG